MKALLLWFSTTEPPKNHHLLVGPRGSYCPVCDFVSHMIELTALFTDLALEAGPSVLRCRYCAKEIEKRPEDGYIDSVLFDENGWWDAQHKGYCDDMCMMINEDPALRAAMELL